MKKLLLIFALSFLSASMIANAKPAKCPDVDVIIAAGFSEIKRADHQWGAVQHSSYNTIDIWDFALVPIKGNSEKQRMANALKIVKSLQFVYGPVGDDTEGWCQYRTAYRGTWAIARYGTSAN